MKIKNRKIVYILVSALICTLFTGCGHSADISAKIVEKSGYFTVGYDPESYHTYDGYGLAVNIIKAAAQRMGVEAPIRPVNDYDWEAHMQNGDINVMLCKNSEAGNLSSPVFTDSIVMVSLTTESIDRVGVIDTKDCVDQKNILSYQGTYEFFYYSDSNLLLADIESGIVDAGIMSEYDALSYDIISDFTVQTLIEMPVYFTVTSEMVSFSEKLNQTLAFMAGDGTIARLKQEYIDSIG